MSARLRVVLVVTIVAAAAATVAVTVAALGSSSTEAPQREPSGCTGGVPFLADLGVRDDARAVALRRAARLYESSRRHAARRPEARRAFERIAALQARVGAALAGSDSAGDLDALARSHPGSSFVRLHLGLALYCTGHRVGATAAWRQAERIEPDTLSAVRAADFLHPDLAPGLPVFEPSFPAPPGLASLRPSAQLRALARAAGRGGAHARILYGVALQRLGRPVSARRQFALAVRKAPGDVDARVADAVGRFDKDRPVLAFSRLGPLTARFPHAATVRFHLGYLLLSLGRVQEGKRQLRLAVTSEPGSPLAREANRLLASLVKR